MLWLLALVGLGAAAAMASSSSSSSSSSPAGGGGSSSKSTGLPRVPSISLALWESPVTGPQAIPADKFNTRGQKFVDPYGLDGGCWPSGGLEDLLRLPSDAKARMTFLHTRAQSTAPKVMATVDMLVATASGLGLAASDKAKQSLIDQRDAWLDRMREYARYTANGWVIGFVELYAQLTKMIPMEWNAVYKRATAIAEADAAKLRDNLVASIAYGDPFPLHVLDGEISGLNDLAERASLVTSNVAKFVVLPESAKGVISSWFALLMSNLGNEDVQRAMTAMDASQWGRRNLASDEQVYLAAAVFAAALGEPVLPFAIELWEKAKGWSRFKGLATNLYLSGADPITKQDTIPSLNQQSGKLGKWYSTARDGDTGFRAASDCVTNARQLNWLDILLTGWEIAASRQGATIVDPRLIRFVPIGGA